MGTRKISARPEHEIAHRELNDLISRHADRLQPIEILAVAANILGKLVAMQDKTKHTPAEVMEVVARNIEIGNRQVIDAHAKAEA